MGEDVGAFARECGGSVLALIGTGTRPESAAALIGGLGESAEALERQPAGEEDVLAHALADADAIVVPGDDESRLAQAAACGRPIYVYPMPESRSDPVRWLRRRVGERAHSRPLNLRGTPRPQQGLEYLCARLIERGLVRPPRDLPALHRTLYRLGIAAPFGTPPRTEGLPALREADEVGRRVRSLLGYT
jgi:hypothetical protein